ncbi:MAG: choice-of-anchor L domain-containing protein, partial [Caulobacterales bacterium]|nr:choice-of-anchor L domain-containing protein [Caulobacterales bacterium]
VRVALEAVSDTDPIDTVTLLRTNGAGALVETLTSLSDEGDVANGDDVAGDGVYSGRVTLSSSVPVQFHFRAEATTEAGLTGRSARASFSIVAPLTEGEIDGLRSTFDAALDLDTPIAAEVMSGEAFENAKTDIITQLNTLDGVDSARLSADGRAIVAEFDSGVTYGVVFVDVNGSGVSDRSGPGSVRNAAVTPRHAEPQIHYYDQSAAAPAAPSFEGLSTAGFLTPAMAEAEVTAIGSYAAFALGPFAAEFGPLDDTTLVYPSVVASTTPVFQAEAAKQDDAVSVDDFKRFDEVGFALVSSHGVTFPDGAIGVFTGQAADGESQELYSLDLKAGRLAVLSTVEIERDEDMVSVDWTSRTADLFVVKPGFIERHNENIPNSLIVLSMCQGLANDSLANVFREAGAGAFVSFTDNVDNAFAGASSLAFTQQMIAGATVAEALAATHASVGSIDDTATPASMAYVGEGALQLDHEGLLNGGFEQGFLGWARNGGDVRVITRLANLSPSEGELFAIVSSGLGSVSNSDSLLYQDFRVPDDASTLTFTYNVISEEPLEFVGSSFDDQFFATLLSGANLATEATIASETINTSPWTAITGEAEDGGFFDGGDGTAFETVTRQASISLVSLRGEYVRVQFHVFDKGDSIYDTAAIIDDVQIQ